VQNWFFVEVCVDDWKIGIYMDFGFDMKPAGLCDFVGWFIDVGGVVWKVKGVFYVDQW